MMTNHELGGGRRPLRRRVLRDAVTVESNAMGRVFTIPADPRPRKLDLRDDAPGWESLQEFRRRFYA